MQFPKLLVTLAMMAATPIVVSQEATKPEAPHAADAKTPPVRRSTIGKQAGSSAETGDPAATPHEGSALAPAEQAGSVSDAAAGAHAGTLTEASNEQAGASAGTSDGAPVVTHSLGTAVPATKAEATPAPLPDEDASIVTHVTPDDAPDSEVVSLDGTLVSKTANEVVLKDGDGNEHHLQITEHTRYVWSESASPQDLQPGARIRAEYASANQQRLLLSVWVFGRS